MNLEQILADMLRAAAAAAQGHWDALRGFAEQEFKALTQAGAQLEQDFLRDQAAALLEPDEAQRAGALQIAKRRAALGFANLKLAVEGVVLAAQADAKLAAQDAVNAALGVLRSAINAAIKIPLL